MTDTSQPVSRYRISKELAQPATSGRKLFGIIMTILASLCVVITLGPLLIILLSIAVRGGDRLFDPEVFTALPPPPLVGGGGFRNALTGTLIMLLIGSLLSVPLGVMAAIYLSEFGRGTRVANAVRFCANILSGVPAIICGLFAYGLVVLTTGTFSAVAGGIALSVLMMPIVLRTVEEGLKSIPRDIRLAAIGIGATQFQMISRIILPVALPTVATGVTLSLARAAGEAAPLLFTALFSQFGINGLFQPTASMAVLVYNYAIVPYENQKELAWVAALVLIGIVLVFSIISRYLTRRRVF